MRTRFGKFVKQAEELFGTIVNGFISGLTFSLVTISHFPGRRGNKGCSRSWEAASSRHAISSWNLRTKKYRNIHSHGASCPLIATAGSVQYAQAIYKLVSRSYLKPSTILSHVSPRDKRIKYEAEEKSKITGFPTARELREAKEAAEARLRREEEHAEKIGIVSLMKTHQAFVDAISLGRNVRLQNPSTTVSPKYVPLPPDLSSVTYKVAA